MIDGIAQPSPSAGCSRHLPANAALTALRAATAERHAYLDRHLPLGQDGEIGLDHYRDHVGLLGSWLAPLWRWLDAAADGPSTFVPGIARQLHRMEQDLAELGGLPPAAATAPDPAGAAVRWGVAYVIEGSQLGAELLHRRLASRLAPARLHYLAGDGAQRGPRWRRFLAALDAAVRSEAAVRDCCSGACLAFDRLLALLAARGVRQ